MTLPFKASTSGLVDEDEALSHFDSDSIWLKQYHQAWSLVHSRIQSTLASIHNASLDEIVSFVDHQTRTRSSPSLLETLTAKATLPVGLVVGANPGASPLLFSSLCRQLARLDRSDSAGSQLRPCLVSRLTGRDCASLRSGLRTIISNFIGSTANDGAFEEEDDEAETFIASSGLKSATLPPEDIQNLSAWYESKFKQSKTGRKPALVIVLEDLEVVDGRILTSLLETLSHCVPQLPLVLLIGVATSADAFYHAVPRSCSDLLDISDFFVEPGIGAFNGLMRSLCTDWDAPVILGPRVYDFLLRTFEDSHYSIDATVSGLQAIVMHHFLVKPAASLALPLDSSLVRDSSDDLVRTIRSLPSFHAVRSITAAGINSDDHVWDLVSTCRSSKAAWVARRRIAWGAIETLHAVWSPRRLVSVQDRLAVLESGQLAERHGDEWSALILHSNATTLVRWLELAIDRLRSNSELDSEYGQTLVHAQERIGVLIEQLKASKEARQNLINLNVAGANVVHGATTLGSRDQEFSALAKTLAHQFVKVLEEASERFDTLALHEIWYANDVSPLKRFHPAYLPCIHRALSSRLSNPSSAPRTTTTPNRRRRDKDEESEPIEDVAAAYALYQETGRLINVADWWAAFDTTAWEEKALTGKRRRGERTSDDQDEDEDEEEDTKRRKQARFLRAVGDLAHLGFLHPTSRKSEHVLKSVF